MTSIHDRLGQVGWLILFGDRILRGDGPDDQCDEQAFQMAVLLT